MDPVTINRLGQIRQQEYLETCLRDQDGSSFGAQHRVMVVWQRLRERLSAALTPQPQKTAARRPNLSATP